MRRRLMLAATYLLVVVIVGLAVPFAVSLQHRLVDQLGGRVEREAYAVGAAVEDPLEKGITAGLQPFARRVAQRIGGRVLVTDANGVLLADSLQAPGPNPPSYAGRPEIASALAGTPNWEVRHSTTLGTDLLVSAVPVRSAKGIVAAVRISYPMDAVTGSVHRAWAFLALVGAVTLLIGLLLAAWLARWLSRPLGNAAAVARRIAGGELDARVPVEGPPEVQELADDMNAMTERLSDLVRANREFAANASHQLRTPLTALRLTLEEAADGPDPRGEARNALQEADRLEAIVSSLLSMGADPAPGADAVDVAALARSIVDERPPAGPEVVVEGSGAARADAVRLRQVLGNLVDNAVRFARRRVVVAIRAGGSRTLVAVEDDGPGIAPEERARVFDRFSRGRDPRGPGSGLGLAVARELARADG
ncbi:MAG TPA: ATP-binding protein, partial [Actinomycetota bacterium]|nr:ATP-binding protein [Actinomycetota bacterium]